MAIGDLDITLVQYKPIYIIDECIIKKEDLFAKSERSNHFCILAMKRTMVEHLLSGLAIDRIAKKFFTTVGKRFQSPNSVETLFFMSKLNSIRYTKFEGLGITHIS